jgi:hypothetical protein
MLTRRRVLVQTPVGRNNAIRVGSALVLSLTSEVWDARPKQRSLPMAPALLRAIETPLGPIDARLEQSPLLPELRLVWDHPRDNALTPHTRLSVRVDPPRWEQAAPPGCINHEALPNHGSWKSVTMGNKQSLEIFLRTLLSMERPVRPFSKGFVRNGAKPGIHSR